MRTPSVHYADTGWQTATTLTFESLSNDDKVTLIVLLSLIFPFAKSCQQDSVANANQRTD